MSDSDWDFSKINVKDLQGKSPEELREDIDRLNHLTHAGLVHPGLGHEYASVMRFYANYYNFMTGTLAIQKYLTERFTYWRLTGYEGALEIEVGADYFTNEHFRDLESMRTFGIEFRYKTSSKFRQWLYRKGLRENCFLDVGVYVV